MHSEYHKCIYHEIYYIFHVKLLSWFAPIFRSNVWDTTHACFACNFWKWVPMHFGTSSDSGGVGGVFLSYKHKLKTKYKDVSKKRQIYLTKGKKMSQERYIFSFIKKFIILYCEYICLQCFIWCELYFSVFWNYLSLKCYSFFNKIYFSSCEISFAGAQWQLPLPCLGGEGGSPEGRGVSMNDN